MDNDGLKKLVMDELYIVQAQTLNSTAKMLESLLTDKQGFDLDDYTITQCVNMVRKLRDRISEKNNS